MDTEIVWRRTMKHRKNVEKFLERKSDETMQSIIQNNKNNWRRRENRKVKRVKKSNNRMSEK